MRICDVLRYMVEHCQGYHIVLLGGLGVKFLLANKSIVYLQLDYSDLDNKKRGCCNLEQYLKGNQEYVSSFIYINDKYNVVSER